MGRGDEGREQEFGGRGRGEGGILGLSGGDKLGVR